MLNMYRKDMVRELLEEEVEDKRQTMNCSISEIHGKLENQDQEIIVDTGSEVSAISKNKLIELEYKCNRKLEQLPINNITIVGVTGVRSKKVSKQVMLFLELNEIRVPVNFLVIENISADIILGMDFLRKHKCVINLAEQILTLEYNGESKEINLINEDKKVTFGLFACYIDQDQNQNQEWIEKIGQIQQIEQGDKAFELVDIFENYKDIFSDVAGVAKDYIYKLKMKEVINFNKKSYPVPNKMKGAVQEEINRMLNDDIIEYGDSEHTSPLVVVPKKDGSVRLCLDARQINKFIIPDKTSTEGIDEILQKFNGARYITKFDLTSGFWQVMLHEESRKYVSFLFNGRNFQFKRLPFGLINSVAVFITCVARILGDDVLEFTTMYVDDLLIVSDNFEEHCYRVSKVLDRLREGNITLKLEKSEFLCHETKFLGYVISNAGISVDYDKIKAIQNFCTPKNLKQLQSFLGMCNYYRKFQQGYSALTGTFSHLLGGKGIWRWTSEDEDNFNLIKTKFLKCVMLKHPNFEEPFYMNSDASDNSVGVELYQMGSDNEHRVIAFGSRTLTKSERNYTVTEKEMLGVVFGCIKFRTYLLGNEIVVRTDHRALTFLQNCKLGHGRLTRWTLALQDYNIKWEHVPGKDNIVADVLSRTNPENGDLRDDSITYNILKIMISDAPLKDVFKDIKIKQREDPKLKIIIRKIETHNLNTNNNQNDNYEPNNHHNNNNNDNSEINSVGGEEVGSNNNNAINNLSEYFLNLYKLEEEILFKRVGVDKRWCLCIPESIIEPLIVEYHGNGGHMGYKKVLKCINENCIFKGMSKRVNQVINKCKLCQQVKISNQKREGEMMCNLAECKLDKVFVDICGPFPISRGNYQFIFIMIDGFTKLVKLYPLRRATTKIILNVITKKYLPEVGHMRTILSDWGTQFKGKLWKDTLNSLNIKTYKSATYHPQSNLAERPLREVGRILRAYCHTNHVSWINYLETVESCLNEAHHDSIGMTPFEAFWDERPRRVIEEMVKFPEDQGNPISSLEREDKIRGRLYKRARERKKKHDEKLRKIIKYEIGDKVLIKNRQLPSGENKIMKKLLVLYNGPFVVTKIKNVNGYEVSSETRIIGTYNVCDLKKFIE